MPYKDREKQLAAVRRLNRERRARLKEERKLARQTIKRQIQEIASLKKQVSDLKLQIFLGVNITEDQEKLWKIWAVPQ